MMSVGQMDSGVSMCDLNIIREKLSAYGVGRRGPDDDFFADCPVAKVYNEPISLADIYPEDYQDLTLVEDELPCQVPGCTEVSKSLRDYDAHYNLAHRYSCSQCKRRLPTAHLLDLHLSEVHDSFFAIMSERKPSFACYVQECTVKSKTPEDRHKHCVEDHKFPSDFKYEVQDHKKKRNKGKKKNKNCDTNLLNNDSNELMDVSPTEKTPVTFFNFGHSQTKSFSKPWYTNKSSKGRSHKNKTPLILSKLDSDDLMVDLKESLTALNEGMTRS